MNYSDDEIDAAVVAGALTREQAAGLRGFLKKNRSGADGEQFRLVGGFNDIFIAIAITVFLLGGGWLCGESATWQGEFAVGVLAWGLAEYFTRQRSLALSSIVLAGFYGMGVGLLVAKLLNELIAPMHQLPVVPMRFNPAHPPVPTAQEQFVFAGICLSQIAALYLHWWRFQVPITVAGIVGAALWGAFTLLSAFIPAAQTVKPALYLVGGLVTFALAMWWDTRDPKRQTRRSDVAFWLHLAAAPMIVHSVFSLFGVLTPNGMRVSVAIVVIGFYLFLTFVALTIDRRALLTAALVYVLFAVGKLIEFSGAPRDGLALAGFVIGAGLLLLSVFWNPARRVAMSLLPGKVQALLPAVSG